MTGGAFTVGRSYVGDVDMLGGTGVSATLNPVRLAVRWVRRFLRIQRPPIFLESNVSDSVTTQPGPYRVGEIPEPADIYVTQYDATGAEVPVNLTGATAVTFKYSVNGGATKTGTAAIQDAVNGIIRITWVAGDFDTAGVLRGDVWYTLGSTRPVAAEVIVQVLTPPVTIS